MKPLPVLGHRRIDPHARPQRRQRIVRRLGLGKRDLDGARHLASCGLSDQANRSGSRAVVSPAHDHGLRAKEIREPLRVDVRNGEAAPVDAHVGQQRVANALVKAARRGGSVVGERHELRFAAAFGRDLLQQKPVHRVADAEREHACVRVLAHLADDLHIVSDLAVGHEADHAHVVLMVRRLERRPDRRHHLGATAALLSVEDGVRSSEVLLCRGNGGWKEDRRLAREGDQVECVIRIQTVERHADALLGLLDRETAHRAGRVEHEHELLWRDIIGRHAVRGLQDQREEPAARIRVRKHGVGNRPSRNVECHHEIPVRNDGLVGELDRRGTRAGSTDRHVVENGFDVDERHSRVELDLDRDVVARTNAPRHEARRDAPGVRHRGGRLFGSLRVRSFGLRLCGDGSGLPFRRYVSRRDNHRKDPCIRAVVVCKHLNVADRDIDSLTRQNVGDRLREDVRALLLEQARRVTLVARSFVFGPSLGAWRDLSRDRAVADLHRHSIDRCTLREWKHIHSLDLVGVRILELLGHGDAREKSADRRMHVGVSEWKDALDGLVRRRREQLAFRRDFVDGRFDVVVVVVGERRSGEHTCADRHQHHQRERKQCGESSHDRRSPSCWLAAGHTSPGHSWECRGALLDGARGNTVDFRVPNYSLRQSR